MCSGDYGQGTAIWQCHWPFGDTSCSQVGHLHGIGVSSLQLLGNIVLAAEVVVTLVPEADASVPSNHSNLYPVVTGEPDTETVAVICPFGVPMQFVEAMESMSTTGCLVTSLISTLTGIEVQPNRVLVVVTQ